MVGGLIFLGLFAFYIAIQYGELGAYDGQIMFQVAQSLVEHGSLQVTDDHFGINTPYSFYGIGMSLVILPLYLVQRALHPGAHTWVTLANPLLLAATAVVISRIGQAIGWSLRRSLAAAVAFGLLTMAPQASTEMFSEPGTTLGLALALLGLVLIPSNPGRGGWILGLGLSIAILFRTDSLVLGGIVVLALPVTAGWRKLASDRRWMPGFISPLVAVAAWLTFYNLLRYGTPVVFDYGGGHRTGFSTPFGDGLVGLTVSGGKGFFWFNPILLLAIPGCVLLWRRTRLLTLAILIVSLSRVLFYAKWNSWYGGTTWGPRLLFPLCAFLTFPAIEAAAGLLRARGRWRFAAPAVPIMLLIASVVVQFTSVWVSYFQWWVHVRNPDVPPDAAAIVSKQQQHNFYWTFQGNHIAGNLRLLTRADPFPLRHFRGGPDAIGVASLIVALGSMGLALATTSSRRPSIHGRLRYAHTSRSAGDRVT